MKLPVRPRSGLPWISLGYPSSAIGCSLDFHRSSIGVQLEVAPFGMEVGLHWISLEEAGVPLDFPRSSIGGRPFGRRSPGMSLEWHWRFLLRSLEFAIEVNMSPCGL